MKMSRLFEIMYLLLTQRLITAKELSEHFGISSRTIYRDVDTLISAGIPIIKCKGKGGGIGLPDTFPGEGTEDNVSSWCRLLEFIGSLYENGSPDPASLFSHLTELLCKREGDWVHIDFTVPKTHCKETFALLKKAILQKQYVNFRYTTPCQDEVLEQVKPAKLCYRGIDWYLFCYTRPDEIAKYYKLNRIHFLKLSNETFHPLDQTVSPPEPFLSAVQFQVKLQIAADAAERIYDEFEENQIEKKEDGSFIVVATYGDESTLTAHILSYGPAATVLSPASVRQQIQESIAQMAKHY